MFFSPLRAHNLREASIIFFADMGAALGGIVLYLFLGNNCESSSSCNVMGFVILPLLLVAVPIITLMIFGHALSIAGSPSRRVLFQTHRTILLAVALLGLVLTLIAGYFGAIIVKDVFLAPEVLALTRKHLHNSISTRETMCVAQACLPAGRSAHRVLSEVEGHEKCVQKRSRV